MSVDVDYNAGLIVQHRVLANITVLVLDILASGQEMGGISRDSTTGSEPPLEEVHEWWLVDSWLYKKLFDRGHIVCNLGYGYLWGRCDTGQRIAIDPVMQELAREIG